MKWGRLGHVKIVEVGPRDGLQNENMVLTVANRLELVKQLVRAGLRHVEFGAFVSPQWVPQMRQSDELSIYLSRSFRQAMATKRLILSALVPNEKGIELAVASRCQHVAIFAAASESFSKANINCSIKQSLERFGSVIKVARARKLPVRGYISVAFGCPYEGRVSPRAVVRLTEALLKLGVYEVSIGDTIGVATPRDVTLLLKQLSARVSMKKLALHFHDTRGTALANVLTGLQQGVRTFDSSIGGLGGCPYAKGASGNLATEDLVYMLEGMGYQTGVDLPALIGINAWLEQLVGHALPSRVARAGMAYLSQ